MNVCSCGDRESLVCAVNSSLRPTYCRLNVVDPFKRGAIVDDVPLEGHRVRGMSFGMVALILCVLSMSAVVGFIIGTMWR